MNGATLLLGLAAVLDVIANALMKKSDGFKRWVPGVLALVPHLADLDPGCGGPQIGLVEAPDPPDRGADVAAQ